MLEKTVTTREYNSNGECYRKTIVEHYRQPRNDADVAIPDYVNQKFWGQAPYGGWVDSPYGWTPAKFHGAEVTD